MSDNFYEDQFDLKFDNDSEIECRKVVVIASTGRSGSHMLGHLLQQTGGLGVPFEYFHQANMERWMELWGCSSLESYVSALKRKRVDAGGVLSFKIHYHQLLAMGGRKFLDQFFGNAHYIHVCRQNQIMQAVSYAKACQDGVWISGQSARATAEYSYRLIYNALRLIDESCMGWRMLALETGVPLLEISMEGLAREPKSVLASIYESVGEVVPSGVEGVSFQTKRQGGRQNQEWAERFALEYRRRTGRFAYRFLKRLLTYL